MDAPIHMPVPMCVTFRDTLVDRVRPVHLRIACSSPVSLIKPARATALLAMYTTAA